MAGAGRALDLSATHARERRSRSPEEVLERADNVRDRANTGFERLSSKAHNLRPSSVFEVEWWRGSPPADDETARYSQDALVRFLTKALGDEAEALIEMRSSYESLRKRLERALARPGFDRSRYYSELRTILTNALPTLEQAVSDAYAPAGLHRVTALARAGNFAAVRAALDRTAVGVQAEAGLLLATALTQVGRGQEAQAIAKKAEYRAHAQAAITLAAITAESGAPHRARLMVLAFPMTGKSQTFMRLAKMHARHHDYEGATVWLNWVALANSPHSVTNLAQLDSIRVFVHGHRHEDVDDFVADFIQIFGRADSADERSGRNE